MIDEEKPQLSAKSRMSSSLQIALTTTAHHDAGSVQAASGARHHVVGVRCARGQNVGGTTGAQASCEVNDAGPRGVLDRNLFGTPFNGPTTVTLHFVASFSRDVRVPFPHFGFVDLLFKICVRHQIQNCGMPQSPARWEELCFCLFFVLVSRERDDTGVYHQPL